MADTLYKTQVTWKDGSKTVLEITKSAIDYYKSVGVSTKILGKIIPPPQIIKKPPVKITKIIIPPERKEKPLPVTKPPVVLVPKPTKPTEKPTDKPKQGPQKPTPTEPVNPNDIVTVPNPISPQTPTQPQFQPDFFNDLLKFMGGTYEPKSTELNQFNWTAGIRKFLEEESLKALKLVTDTIKNQQTVNLDKALDQSILSAIPPFLGGIGIYAATTLTDLLQPLKGTGIVPAGIDITNKLGTGLFTNSIVGSYAKSAIDSPLVKYFNRIARGNLPNLAETNQMFFEGHINYDEWLKIYEFAGWQNKHILAQFKTMFIEPSDRLLIRMFEDPNIDVKWIDSKLKERGYNVEDRNVLTKFAIDTGNSSYKAISYSNAVKRFTQGYTIKPEFINELKTLGTKESQISRIVLNAEIAKDTNYREDQLTILKTAFQKSLLTSEEFRDSIKRLVPDETVRTQIVSLENLKKLPKPKIEKIAVEKKQEPDYDVDELKILQLQFEKDVISELEFERGIKRLVPDETEAEQIIKLEELKKLPKPKVEKKDTDVSK